MVTHAVLRVMMPHMKAILMEGWESDMWKDMERVALAMVAYRAEKGAWPKELKELAPGYLPTVPVDVFSGKDLIYKLQDGGYIIYSVGVNGLDEGGQGKEPGRPDDIAIEGRP